MPDAIAAFQEKLNDHDYVALETKIAPALQALQQRTLAGKDNKEKRAALAKSIVAYKTFLGKEALKDANAANIAILNKMEQLLQQEEAQSTGWITKNVPGGETIGQVVDFVGEKYDRLDNLLTDKSTTGTIARGAGMIALWHVIMHKFQKLGQYEVEKKDSSGNVLKDAAGNTIMEKKNNLFGKIIGIVKWLGTIATGGVLLGKATSGFGNSTEQKPLESPDPVLPPHKIETLMLDDLQTWIWDSRQNREFLMLPINIANTTNPQWYVTVNSGSEQKAENHMDKKHQFIEVPATAMSATVVLRYKDTSAAVAEKTFIVRRPAAAIQEQMTKTEKK